MALGATGPQVVLDLLSGAGAMVGLGLALGALLGWQLSQALAPLLFATKGSAPMLYLGVASLLLPTALLACLLPALRAARVSPAQALRSE